MVIILITCICIYCRSNNLYYGNNFNWFWEYDARFLPYGNWMEDLVELETVMKQISLKIGLYFIGHGGLYMHHLLVYLLLEFQKVVVSKKSY